MPALQLASSAQNRLTMMAELPRLFRIFCISRLCDIHPESFSGTRHDVTVATLHGISGYGQYCTHYVFTYIVGFGLLSYSYWMRISDSEVLVPLGLTVHTFDSHSRYVKEQFTKK